MVGGVYSEVPITLPPTAAAGVRLLTVRRAPVAGSFEALCENGLVVNFSDVCYDPNTARFSVARLYQGKIPFVEFLFVLISLPQSINIRRRL